MFSDAKQCLARGDYQQAIQILQRAHGIDPANEKILIELGFAYGMSYDFSTAERHFENAVAIAPSKTHALIAVGHRWMDARHFAASAKTFERALQQGDAPMVVFVRLVELYIRLRRLEEAAAIAERAMSTDAAHEGALLSRAKVHRQMRQFEQAEKLLRNIVSKTSYPAEPRAAAWYELGSLLDQQERFDEAMAAMLEAKALLRADAPSFAATFQAKQAQMKEMQQSFTEAVVQKWRKFGETDLQPARRLALLCGHARSGTTLLEYVLDSHPQIVSADETYVFHSKAYPHITPKISPKTSLFSVLDAMPGRIVRQIRTEYFRGIESFFGQPVGERLLLDKNPPLTFDLPAFTRIFPEAKFVVALRDPRDVCLSSFMQPWPVLPDTLPWLTLEGTIANYCDTMGFWLALKPRIGKAAIEVRYEDLVENLESAARPVLEFLGCGWDERVRRFDEHARSRVVHSPTHVEVGKPIFKSAVGRWQKYQKYFEPHLAKLEPFLKAFGYGV